MLTRLLVNFCETTVKKPPLTVKKTVKSVSSRIALFCMHRVRNHAKFMPLHVA